LENKNLKELIIKISLLAVFLIIFIVISIKFAPIAIDVVKNTQKFKDFILSFGKLGILIFMGFQVLQVVIAVIPGEIFQAAGGFIYGTVFGSIYTSIGILIGSIIVFIISKIFGYSLVKLFVPKKKFEELDFLINSKKTEVVMFFLFLIPGIPKDALTYIAGLTPIKPIRFFVISLIARFPAIVGSSYFGAHIGAKDKTVVIIISIIAIVLFVLGVLFQNKIIDFLHNFKLNKKNNP